MNNPITSTEIDAVIKNLPYSRPPPPKKIQGQMASLENSIKHLFREEVMPILLKHLQKIAEEGTLPN